MSRSAQLQSLKHQLQENHDAFKKNKQNFSLQSNYAKPLKSNSDLKQINQSVKSSLSSLLRTKQSSTEAYQCAIKHLKLLLQQAWTKNEFLTKDRALILRENFALKQNIEQLTKGLEEAKACIQEMKLNGYSGNCVNGMYEDGSIFRVGNDVASRIVQEIENYSIQQRSGCKRQYYSKNSSNEHNQQSNNLSSPNDCPSQQQSLLLRQVSAQHFLPSPSLNHNHQSPAISSQQSSQINKTPNYNFKSDLQNMINPVKNHYVDIGSEIISQNNSWQGSEQKSQKSKKNIQDIQMVQISMNNLNFHNQLYLPLDDKNRKYLKQEIETFKSCLHMVNASQDHDYAQEARQSQQYYQRSQPPSQLHSTQFIYCSSECQQGIFRAFYLSIIRFFSFRQKFFQNLKDLQHDDSFLLFSLYPKNGFWIEMLGNFLHWIQIDKPSHEEVLKHLNTHKLIDMLLIQTLKYRVQWMYNNCSEQLNQSSLLNNSITNNTTNHPQTHHLPTNRQPSVNCSFQQPPEKPSEFLQFFTGLCNEFGLECKKDSRGFYFYQSQQQQSPHQTQPSRPLFIIMNMQQMNAFGFEFSLFYEKSISDNSRVDQMATSQQYRSMKPHQLQEYSNSVKKNFRNIQINDPESGQEKSNQQQKSSQNSNLLNSYSNSHEKYYEERQFVSQTNQYEEENSDEEFKEQEQDNSSLIDLNQLSYHTTTRQAKFNSTTRNLTSLLNNKHSNQSSLRSHSLTASISNEPSYDLNGQRNHQLKQLPLNYNTLSHNCPIPEDLAQSQSKQLLYNSFGKSNHLNLSKIPQFSALNDGLRNTTQQVYGKNENITQINSLNKISQKTKNRYPREQIFNENFILNQVKTIQSESSDSVIHSDSYLDDDDDDNNINWKPKLNFR